MAEKSATRMIPRGYRTVEMEVNGVPLEVEVVLGAPGAKDVIVYDVYAAPDLPGSADAMGPITDILSDIAIGAIEARLRKEGLYFPTA